MKKSFFRVFAVLLSVTFCIGCSGGPPASQSTAVNSEYYILIDNRLVGSYANGHWYNADENKIYIGELIQPDAYYCYDQTKLLGVSGKLTFQLRSYLWRSFAEGRALMDYSSDYNLNNEMVTFNLPQQLPAEVITYDCLFGNEKYDFDINFSSEDHTVPIAISADFNPLPNKEVKNLTGSSSKADYDAVKAELERLGIPGASVNITEVEEFDINGDRKKEQFIFAQTPFTEKGYHYVRESELENNQTGYYNIILYKDKKGYKTVDSWCSPYLFDNENTSIESGTFYCENVRWNSMIGIYDLNDDGLFELCVNQQGYETGKNVVYSLNKNGEWEQVLSGCYDIDHPSVSAPSEPGDFEYPEPIFEDDPGYFIFLYDTLVGSYHDNQWHTIENRDLSVADLLSQDAYYHYNQCDSDDISKEISFAYYNDFGNSFDDDPKPLFPFASEDDTEREYISFKLPCKIPQELRSIRYNSYNSNIFFGAGYSTLTLSADFNPLPKSQIIKLPGPYSKEDQAAVATELQRLNIPDAPVNITECYNFDYNGDSVTERFIIANAPRGEDGYVYKFSPFYYIVLCKDKTGYKTVASWTYPNDGDTATQYMEMIGLFDLNNDGLFEICLYDYQWEHYEIQVYSVNKQDQWECVLTGYGGM